MTPSWILLFSPMAACVLIVLFTRRFHKASAGLAIIALGTGLICSVLNLFHLFKEKGHHVLEASLPWIQVPGLSLEFGLLMDPAAVLMSLVVTGVGLMIFIYSTGYMHGERGFTRYFATLALFAFSMLGIVLSNNFVTMFIFWELVGASSYLLIGHWYEKPSAAEAGKKAFLVNRIADFGFLLGILMIWQLSGSHGEPRTLNFVILAQRLGEWLAEGTVSIPTLGTIGALIFCGVLGKSAQFPLHVWLPDAMEGPTPVSALIHAATMVAAGVYLLARVFFLFSGAPELMFFVAVIGGFTSLFAASLALVENDIKRVLAYSTLSQLGYMVMSLGLGGYVAGLYHLTTHAFFKALLFLGAGSVIHALHTNNIWEMGGLYKKMPVTSLTFLIASLALCGIFPLSGFWSKDEILSVAFAQNKLLWLVGTLTAGMTAYYMGRLFTVAFLGKARSKAVDHAQESPYAMTIPLIVLAILSTVAGFIGIPEFIHHGYSGGVHLPFNMGIAAVSSLVAVAGLGLAYAVYAKEFRPLAHLIDRTQGLKQLLLNKYYIDEIYAWINRNIQQRLADLLFLFERYVIMGLWVNGVAKLTGLTGSLLRLAQTGKVQSYALTLLAGFILILYVSFK
jgi:NADH-quinone oxidoreductase subunit L